MSPRASQSTNRKRGRGKTPRTVPVASRERGKDQRAAKATAKKRRLPAMFQQDITSTAILIALVIAVLIAIAVPLRNYYEGRAEIARAQSSIEQLERRKAELEADIAKYEDPAYVEQEARRRLGVMAEGESAWRIIDPRMSHSPSITTDEVPDERSWSEVMWDSLRELPEPDAPAPTEHSEQPTDASQTDLTSAVPEEVGGVAEDTEE
ncbi:septum formation initiator family protein [Corynebacterium sp. p3-SID1056]|uniref:FtsB family cell division protein n=1 Tax=Corynebacterium sp. p3-SID1056 TaxID=2916092 RepID=UPI0021A59EF3|nr:septum formation initiator family protein [Corynebacterium sp. p3-SID1056]MCT2339134.1 septum formation initiator family protein [Corynebacterium sp. p3-SID1056]